MVFHFVHVVGESKENFIEFYKETQPHLQINVPFTGLEGDLRVNTISKTLVRFFKHKYKPAYKARKKRKYSSNHEQNKKQKQALHIEVEDKAEDNDEKNEKKEKKEHQNERDKQKEKEKEKEKEKTSSIFFGGPRHETEIESAEHLAAIAECLELVPVYDVSKVNQVFYKGMQVDLDLGDLESVPPENLETTIWSRLFKRFPKGKTFRLTQWQRVFYKHFSKYSWDEIAQSRYKLTPFLNYKSMASGKTKEKVYLFNAHPTENVDVVCLKSQLNYWFEQISEHYCHKARFATHYRIFAYGKYELSARKNLDISAKGPVVVDEPQKLRNVTDKMLATLKAFRRARANFYETGTPFINSVKNDLLFWGMTMGNDPIRQLSKQKSSRKDEDESENENENENEYGDETEDELDAMIEETEESLPASTQKKRPMSSIGKNEKNKKDEEQEELAAKEQAEIERVLKTLKKRGRRTREENLKMRELRRKERELLKKKQEEEDAQYNNLTLNTEYWKKIYKEFNGRVHFYDPLVCARNLEKELENFPKVTRRTEHIPMTWAQTLMYVLLKNNLAGVSFQTSKKNAFKAHERMLCNAYEIPAEKADANTFKCMKDGALKYYKSPKLTYIATKMREEGLDLFPQTIYSRFLQTGIHPLHDHLASHEDTDPVYRAFKQAQSKNDGRCKQNNSTQVGPDGKKKRGRHRKHKDKTKHFRKYDPETDEYVYLTMRVWTGSESAKERLDIQNGFNARKIDILGFTLSANTGTDLHGARRLYMVEPCNNEPEKAQAEARVVRMKIRKSKKEKLAAPVDIISLISVFPQMNPTDEEIEEMKEIWDRWTKGRFRDQITWETVWDDLLRKITNYDEKTSEVTIKKTMDERIVMENARKQKEMEPAAIVFRACTIGPKRSSIKRAFADLLDPERAAKRQKTMEKKQIKEEEEAKKKKDEKEKEKEKQNEEENEEDDVEDSDPEESQNEVEEEEEEEDDDDDDQENDEESQEEEEQENDNIKKKGRHRVPAASISNEENEDQEEEQEEEEEDEDEEQGEEEERGKKKKNKKKQKREHDTSSLKFDVADKNELSPRNVVRVTLNRKK